MKHHQPSVAHHNSPSKKFAPLVMTSVLPARCWWLRFLWALGPGSNEAKKCSRNQDVCLSIAVPICCDLVPHCQVARMGTNVINMLQVVPGQARGGSFKFETLKAYRAEQRPCL